MPIIAIKKLFLLPFIFVVISLKAIEYPQLKPLPNIIDGKSIPNVKPVLGDFLYMGETEVTNAQYQSFLNWLKKNKTEEYSTNLPDTVNWGLLTFCQPFIDVYFRHPAYKNFPVVNVSQKQAINYCEWLHDSLVNYFKLKKSKIENFIVRLPTEKEWIMAARGGLPETAIYPWEGNEIRKLYKGKSLLMLNCSEEINQDRYFTTAEVHSYWPNGFGLYNMSGNVAEWISEAGKTKGGSWNLFPYNARIDMQGYRDGEITAKPDIGFRYIIEIISVKDECEHVTLNNKYFKEHFQFVPAMDTLNHNLLFAGESEVTNGEYNTFLSENIIQEYQIVNANWSFYFPYKYYEMYGMHSEYNNFPVVNISHNAALAYCNWLTKKYNSLEKRKYKKVIFRLPAETEWEWMALGGKGKNIFPWGGPYLRNSKGCYIANFSPIEEKNLYKTDSLKKYPSGFIYKYPNGDFSISRGIDGSIIPTRVKSYFPNDYGLYNISGNVAEMINDFGKTKGGSWDSEDYYLQIKSQESYNQPDPTVGFRVLMEVLEK